MKTSTRKPKTHKITSAVLVIRVASPAVPEHLRLKLVEFSIKDELPMAVMQPVILTNMDVVTSVIGDKFNWQGSTWELQAHLGKVPHLVFLSTSPN